MLLYVSTRWSSQSRLKIFLCRAALANLFPSLWALVKSVLIRDMKENTDAPGTCTYVNSCQPQWQISGIYLGNTHTLEQIYPVHRKDKPSTIFMFPFLYSFLLFFFLLPFPHFLFPKPPHLAHTLKVQSCWISLERRKYFKSLSWWHQNTFCLGNLYFMAHI